MIRQTPLAVRRECGLPVEGPRLRATAMDCPPSGSGAEVDTLEGEVAGNVRTGASSFGEQSGIRRCDAPQGTNREQVILEGPLTPLCIPFTVSFNMV